MAEAQQAIDNLSRLLVEPAPPPAGVPLDQTTAPIHYEGDTTSV